MSKVNLSDVSDVYSILKEYDGNNPVIIDLKNRVFAYKNYSLTEFDIDLIKNNYNKEPIFINKIVKIADWWGLKKQEDWGTEFVPEKLHIGWYLGETDTVYIFYCKYRRSMENGVLTYAPKKAILTDFLSPDHNSLEVDFKPYNERSGLVLYPHQEEAVKFLISRKKCILANGMGSGKSASAIVASLEGKFKHILIICPASVKTTWYRELIRYVNDDEITIVSGSNWKDSKFTIINYDILKNFYEIPTTVVKKSELDLDEHGNLISTYKEKEVVSRKKDVIDAAMSNSQLFLSEFDLIIIDEAHRLSNTSSGIFKIVSDLVKRSNPDGIFELTGTPITNNNKNLYNLLKIIGHPITKDWEYYMKRYCGAKSFYNKKERNAISSVYIRSHNKNTWYDLNYDEKKELDDILEKKCKKIWTFPESTNSEELSEIIKKSYLRRETRDFVKLPEKHVKELRYKLTNKEKSEYYNVWNEYVETKSSENPDIDVEKYKKITEGVILRQWLANTMIGRTIKLAKKILDKGEKVVIFCSFDNEIEALSEEFKDISVYHNGKITQKRKDKAVDEFQNNDNIKVFIGNLDSSSVGITLTAANNVIFNSVDFVPGINLQAEDRISRIGQTKECNIYYQTFDDTYLDHVMEIIENKSDNINKIIINEKDK